MAKKTVSLPPGVDPENVSVDQACVIIGVGRSTLYKLIADGRLDSITLDGRRLIKLRSARSLGSAAA